MRWLALLAAVAIVAVAAWWWWPGEQRTGVEPKRLSVLPVPLVAEAPTADASAPPAQHATLDEGTDSGPLVDVHFEVVGEEGRVIGTRITLTDADRELKFSGLTDVMGLAHIDVPVGKWRANCSNDCFERTIEITASPTLHTLRQRRLLEISGVVVDSTGQPVARASIEPEADRRGFSPSGIGATSLTDGTFSFKTDLPQLVLVAINRSGESATRRVAPPQRGLRFVIPMRAEVAFTFSGVGPTELVSMHSVVNGEPVEARLRLSHRGASQELPVGHHEAVFFQAQGDHLQSAKAGFDVKASSRNEVDVSLSSTHGMIVHVVDGTGQSLGGVTVRASYRYSDGDAVPEATHCEVQDDGGYLVRRDRDDRDMVRPTDMQGAVEFLPNDTTAMPLFELELDAPLKASKPRLMRLGDEPITIVAVPR